MLGAEGSVHTRDLPTQLRPSLSSERFLNEESHPQAFLSPDFPSASETSQRPGVHAEEVHTPLHPLHQAQRDQEAQGLGGEQVN